MSVYDASERGRMASHGAASTASDRHRVAQERGALGGVERATSEGAGHAGEGRGAVVLQCA
eukprot:9491121-Pyramimonas_sp.AAC.1